MIRWSRWAATAAAIAVAATECYGDRTWMQNACPLDRVNEKRRRLRVVKI